MKISPLCLVASVLAVAGCSEPPAPLATDEELRPHEPQKIAALHLPNAYQIHPQVISGGLPEGDPAFKELADLGVKTVISVDGATPDVATAKRYGLRYVHLPHGYDGIPSGRTRELAKAVRDLPGPVYIHCHHGKHRSPTAAAVACVAAGLIDRTNAELILRTAGTSESYRGLYQSARRARRLETELLDALAADFPETAAIPPLAESMVAMEHTHDHLKAIAAAGWASPPDHPDLDPAHEALLLREHFTELLRLDAIQAEPMEFRQYLTDSERSAEELEAGLRNRSSVDKIAATFTNVSKLCADCHQLFRDVPLGEKGLNVR